MRLAMCPRLQLPGRPPDHPPGARIVVGSSPTTTYRREISCPYLRSRQSETDPKGYVARQVLIRHFSEKGAVFREVPHPRGSHMGSQITAQDSGQETCHDFCQVSSHDTSQNSGQVTGHDFNHDSSQNFHQDCWEVIGKDSSRDTGHHFSHVNRHDVDEDSRQDTGQNSSHISRKDCSHDSSQVSCQDCCHDSPHDNREDTS